MADPYWHSPVQIDSGLGGQGGAKGGRKAGGRGGGRNRDGWAPTMGDAQYQWFKRTLEQSNAKYKFVFAHHVLGTGRGGVELADLIEWGGRNRSGEEKDGVIYQATPNPADNSYTAFNREAYRSGDIFPDSGYLRVTVAPESARVDYTRAPEHSFDVILTRPTSQSVTASVLANQDMEGYLEYGVQRGTYSNRTALRTFKMGEPSQIEMQSLRPDTRYHYRLRHRPAGAPEFAAGTAWIFHTQRSRGTAFTFAVQADSDLDENADPGVYLISAVAPTISHCVLLPRRFRRRCAFGCTCSPRGYCLISLVTCARLSPVILATYSRTKPLPAQRLIALRPQRPVRSAVNRLAIPALKTDLPPPAKNARISSRLSSCLLSTLMVNPQHGPSHLV